MVRSFFNLSSGFNFFRLVFLPFFLYLIFYFSRTLHLTSDYYFSFFSIVSVFLVGFFLARNFFNVSPVLLFFVVFFSYVTWASSVQTIPESDYLIYYNDAVRFLNGNFFHVWTSSKYPSSSIVYAFGMKLLGVSYLSASITAAACWALQAVVVRAIMLELGQSGKISTFTAFLYALFPAVFVYTAVVSSEATYLLYLFISIFSFLRFIKTKNLLFLVTSAFFIGFAYYSRPTSVFLIFPFLLGVVLYSDKAIKSVVCFLVPLLLVFSSHALLNSAYQGFFSVNSNHGMGGYVLLFGTNKNHNGLYNTDDVEFVQELRTSLGDEGKVGAAIKEEIYSRIFDDFPGFSKFAYKQKIKTLWVPSGGVFFWANNNPEHKVSQEYASLSERINSHLYYILLILFFVSLLVYFFKKRNENNIREFLYFSACAYVFQMIAFYFVFEVQSRYALSIMPFMLFAVSAISLSWSSDE
ncbi:glycosyltransferase family 39 protein [Alcaligenes sp. A-TC2]|uniref:glycosyltransferase family 39 protein n=1 Tax=Alcaligenes TaxID=507 RepID=UPI0020A706DA|nr:MULTISPECIES: glycosyltransferase family 39 protein [Alcaligenes]MCX5471941.1 glycosyltransferase family 39 protein [Alcaligenes nematophilus]USY25022.1 glycosyltransferase family 39 protein [Alcaligenes sp. 1735tsa3]